MPVTPTGAPPTLGTVGEVESSEQLGCSRRGWVRKTRHGEPFAGPLGSNRRFLVSNGFDVCERVTLVRVSD